ncbi:hypothetical protein [Mycoplasmopsis felis]|uniref:hypothetical protein n=1 Tax=Mycoplasmopsis felis TaxID=33923 RepID=UPI002AFF5E5A|nr:hypothetical protein [Mycoplasmopsis felis]WQQ03493.1 hypothetical protein RRG38_01380 [Mycoplasmopsis felis]WQQ04209.1 hypothetical protein RRG47_01385 [Mycoplasmopsis felis]WQQ05761.1 hypothetical protein RRG59_01465 [Mycoplasmopsis felis]WQQ08394.1 hypothetical protein RRG61_03685 [Mycoplasmopsis felis]WQQ10386.1 hypothetical protein RRG49_01455 [Mycoplasmopsis felis]
MNYVVSNLLTVFMENNSSSTQGQNQPKWVYLVVGILLIVASLIMLYFYKLSLQKMRNYKEKQLEEYKKDNPRLKGITYENSGLYLPGWERMKYNIPLFLTVLFISIAILMFIYSAK